MAAPLAVLSKTHHTSATGAMRDIAPASAVRYEPSYDDQYFRGEP